MPDSKTTPAWRRPEVLLLVAAAASPLAWATWSALLNNFVIEQAAFTGREIGILQSLREVPGFLAFAVVFLLLMIREQRLMYLSLVLLGVGTAITGFFPDALGLYVTTMIMSLGFHYFETVKDSLALQWLRRDQAAHWLGRLISVGSFASLVAFCLIWMAMKLAGLDFVWIYAIGGGATVVAALWLWAAYPLFPQKVEQHKRIILRPRYWLYYALTFAAGARRQIFVVFAAFLLVEKFGLDASTIAIVFLINGATTVAFAPQIGKWIGRWGERKALTFEYVGLILVFTAYAFVDSWWLAVGLYVIDHLLFAMAIAMKTYIQKIADPADIASSIGVSFTINHIAAVVIPALFGLLWIVSPAAVFLTGAAMATLSLALARMVPPAPTQERVSVFTRAPAVAGAAE